MKYRTLLKRQRRFWQIQTLHCKRVHYSRVLTKADGQVEHKSLTKKMEAQYHRADRLYREAYNTLFSRSSPLADYSQLARPSMLKRYYTAYERATPPGRNCDLSTVEEKRK